MVQKKHIIIIFFFLYSLLSFGQKNTKRIDSISSLLVRANSDSLRVRHHIELGILKDKTNPNEAEKHLKTALDLLASKYLFLDKQSMKALAYDCLGIIERRNGNYDKAYAYYLNALKIKENEKDYTKIGRSYHNIAMLFSAKRDYKKAIEYIKKALPIRKKNDSLNYAISLNSYGSLLIKTKQYNAALSILDSAKIYYKNNFRKTDANNNIARVYKRQKKYNDALVIQLENISIYKVHEKLERLAHTHKDVAYSLRKLNNYNLALKHLDSSEVISKKIGDKKTLSNINKERYRIANQQKKFKVALQYYKQHKKYEDSVFNNNQSEKIKQLELEFTFEKKTLADSLRFKNHKTILLKENQSERTQKKWFAILFVVSSLGLVAIFFAYRYHRKINKAKNNKLQLESKLLNEQIDFLRYKTEQVLADNMMRSYFNKELSDRIKTLRKTENSKLLLQEYQSIIIQLNQQSKTEKKLDHISNNISSNEISFEELLNSKYSTLTKSEREVCKLLYLNMGSKEIMNSRNLTASSIKSIRFRIRKKLNVPKGEELELFIQKLK